MADCAAAGGPVLFVNEEACLDFIRDKRSWGVFFRRGFFEINESDFRTLERGFGTAVTVGAAKAG